MHWAPRRQTHLAHRQMHSPGACWSGQRRWRRMRWVRRLQAPDSACDLRAPSAVPAEDCSPSVRTQRPPASPSAGRAACRPPLVPTASPGTPSCDPHQGSHRGLRRGSARTAPVHSLCASTAGVRAGRNPARCRPWSGRFPAPSSFSRRQTLRPGKSSVLQMPTAVRSRPSSAGARSGSWPRSGTGPAGRTGTRPWWWRLGRTPPCRALRERRR